MKDPEKKPGYTLLIVSIALAIFMAALDTLIVNIALPTIMESFHVSSNEVSWVATVYLMVMAGCVLIFGKVSDDIGFKRIFLAGFFIFITGSLMCGILPVLTGSFWVLVGSRAFQAIGGAMITAVPVAMVTEYVPARLRGKAMGIVVTMTALGAALGPSLGGILTEYLSWQWIFFINVPVGITAIILGSMVIPDSERRPMKHGFDWPGAVLIFIGLALMLFGVSEGNTRGWGSPVIIGSLLASVIILALFVKHEQTFADPLLQVNLFRDRDFFFFNVAFCLLLFSVSGVFFFMPFFLKYICGYPTATAGLILTPFSIFTMFAGIIAGMLYNRTGGRALLIWASVITVLGYFLLFTMNADTPAVIIIIFLSITGFGGGLYVPPVSNMVMTMVSRQYQGMVSSLMMVERFGPLTMGIAFFNQVFVNGKEFFSHLFNAGLGTDAGLQLKVLTASFDVTFLSIFLIGLGIVIFSWIARYKVHPDYIEKKDETPMNGAE
jgi:EmrB/QacA subfamily drug resistance transporter